MKPTLTATPKKFNCIFVFFLLLTQTLCSGTEYVTLTASSAGNEYGYSQTISLQEGDLAKLTSVGLTGGGVLEISIREDTFVERLRFWAGGQNAPILNPIEVAGPALLKLRVSGSGASALKDFATIAITRRGSPSSPTAIPIEAGSHFNVVLESSSDLENWSPTNPGSYTGTEPRRYFRVRIVKTN